MVDLCRVGKLLQDDFVRVGVSLSLAQRTVSNRASKNSCKLGDLPIISLDQQQLLAAFQNFEVLDLSEHNPMLLERVIFSRSHPAISARANTHRSP